MARVELEDAVRYTLSPDLLGLYVITIAGSIMVVWGVGSLPWEPVPGVALLVAGVLFSYMGWLGIVYRGISDGVANGRSTGDGTPNDVSESGA